MGLARVCIFLELQIRHTNEPINGRITYRSQSDSPGSAVLNVNSGKSLNLSRYLFFIYKTGVNDPCLKGFWWWIIEIIYLYLVSNFSASFIACSEDDENRFSLCFTVTEFLKAWSVGVYIWRLILLKWEWKPQLSLSQLHGYWSYHFHGVLRGRVGDGVLASISCWGCHRWLWRVRTQKGNKKIVSEEPTRSDRALVDGSPDSGQRPLCKITQSWAILVEGLEWQG